MTKTMEEGNQYKKGLWTKEEDMMLMDCVKLHGEGQWNHVSKKTGTSVDLLLFLWVNPSFHLLFNGEDEF